MTIVELVRLVEGYRLPMGQEADLQASVQEILERGGVSADREYDLGPGAGRIDFYVRSLRAGLELKVKGSPSDVTRQLLRYAHSREIDHLVLVTSRARLGALPPMLAGKPLHIASVWRGGF